MKKKLFLIARLAVIGGLIVFAVSKFDRAAAANVLASSRPILGIAALLLGGIAIVFNALRWKRILRGFWPAQRFSVSRLFYYNNLALFYTLFIPTSIAGETVRAVKLAGSVGNDRSRSIIAVFLDRLLGALTWFLIFLATPSPFGGRKFWLVLPIAAAGVYLARTKISFFGHELFDLSRHHPADAAWGFVHSVVGQFVSILSTYAAFRCFGIELTLLQVSGLSAVAALAGVIPLSLLGISMREGSLLGLLPLYGVSSTQSVLVITFFVSANYLFGLLGGVIDMALAGWKFSRLKMDTGQENA